MRTDGAHFASIFPTPREKEFPIKLEMGGLLEKEGLLKYLIPKPSVGLEVLTRDPHPATKLKRSNTDTQTCDKEHKEQVLQTYYSWYLPSQIFHFLNDMNLQILSPEGYVILLA